MGKDKQVSINYWWVCRICGQEVWSKTTPNPIQWSDGHTCLFVKKAEYDEMRRSKRL